MSFIRRFFSSTPSVTMSAAQKKTQQLINDNSVVVFSKTYCSYCRNTKRILDGFGANYRHYEVNQEDDGDDIQNALEQMTGQRTVPNIFIGKKHIGGNSDLEGKNRKELEALLREAGAIQ